MTAPAPAASTPATRRHSGLAIGALVTTGVGLVVVGVMVLISLIPEMQAILWLLIVVIPATVILAFVGLILAVIALVPAIQRQQSVVLPVIGIILPIAVMVIGASFLGGWWV